MQYYYQQQQPFTNMNGSPLFYAFMFVAVAAALLSILPSLLKPSNEQTPSQKEQEKQKQQQQQEQVEANVFWLLTELKRSLLLDI